MKICLQCAARFDGAEWHCRKCGFEPQAVGDSIVHAPPLAQASGSGFQREEFALLFSLEATNFWFRERNRLIIATLRRYCPEARGMLEIGCGTGFVLRGIGEAFPQWNLFGSEVSLTGLEYAKSRNPRATLFQMDACQIPYDKEFDVIGAFDVLEHIEDDSRVASEIFNALQPGGRAIFTVPQHMFLWSERDRRAGHVRRYGVRELKNKLEAAGFSIETYTSFVTLLLPALYLGRRFTRRSAPGEPIGELHLPPTIDRVFGWTLALERKMIDLGMRFPVGGSQLLIARKPG